MLERTVQIVSNERDTDLYFRLVMRAPEMARDAQPGQFVHLRVAAMRDALLRRPFSIYQARGDTLSVLYKSVGKGTDVLARMGPGEELSLIGPLGHGFTLPKAGGETPLLVAGGYGMAAMYMLAERSPQRGIVFAGGRRRVDILCEDEFQKLGWDVRVTTEDGSYGEKGLVTHPLIAELRRSAAGRKLFACGPTPMLKAVGKIAEEFKVPAELSMDEHMCCGVGVCLTCVIPVKTTDGWEYQRTCTEGPVFDASEVMWEMPK
ncbi:MAG: dihydroorotate dehydrogenase electron transfer subunit [Verrucomicrobia bacterium]|nr:dihydroorotate dehydrogenase electron transfer subunit [Verrucomicrobiota bacterium]